MKSFKFTRENGMYQIGAVVQLDDIVANSFEKIGLGKIINDESEAKKVTKKTTKTK